MHLRKNSTAINSRLEKTRSKNTLHLSAFKVGVDAVLKRSMSTLKLFVVI